MKTIYNTYAFATGGRNGHVTSAHDLINADVRYPKALGGPDDEHLTPEVFFATGYAACFDSAVLHIMRNAKLDTTESPVTQANIALMLGDANALSLAVELKVFIPSVTLDMATELLNKAHEICPYSKATRGNIPVTLTVLDHDPRS
ncbi:Ohr family peroxiredoxin [Mucilaginibacter sp. SG564]|uniref:Ohr family peroxiredoxin n=1 Tax=Mucilaginibacter sp. SG564 TaxID=2587022 RepID=UPI001555D604|nr:Ohr family peroxiredoxin [Mucilaginibacter sp. SG564]NOW95926.1 Ohr subfamily peroxiredoxin [Mucilaginibacter sp. SG564]